MAPESGGAVTVVPVPVPVPVLGAEYLVAVRLEVIAGAREADNQEEEWSRCFAVVRGG